MAPKGLMGIDSEDELEVRPLTTERENTRIMERLMQDWNLGPEKASPKPGDNKPYWNKMAAVWGVSEAQARRQLCANCEYFDDTPEKMQGMESVPFNKFDADGGGRGWCHKFDFICHNLRTCQAWEYRPYEEDED
jgi:hypothetical protein